MLLHTMNGNREEHRYTHSPPKIKSKQNYKEEEQKAIYPQVKGLAWNNTVKRTRRKKIQLLKPKKL